MEYSEMFDVVKFEKEKALARFNRLRRIAKFRQVFEVAVVLGLIFLSTPRAPAALRAAAASAVEFSAYLLNHHVVFLIGNAIIVSLFVLCRQSDAVNSSADGDFYGDYLKHSEAAHHREPTPPPPSETPCYEEKQIVVRAEETAAVAAAPPQLDDVSAAIDMATRQIKRFQRTQSERLRREIGVRPQQELRRSETQNCRKSGSCGEPADMESLSSEEFRRTVDAFIDKHWVRKKTKHHQLIEEHEKYHLMKMAY